MAEPRLATPWLAAVEIVHRLSGRVRLRYRFPRGVVADVAGLERLTTSLCGVTSVRANAHARSLTVTFDPDVTDAETLREGVSVLAPPSGIKPSRPCDRGPVAAALATLLGTGLLPPPLRLPVSLAGALPLLRHAAADYRESGVTSHVLEGMAVAISLGRSDYTAANTTTFMLALGEYMEDSIARRSDELLKHLLRPASDEIWVLRDGVEILEPAATVVVGDTVIIATGSVIPVDGTVAS